MDSDRDPSRSNLPVELLIEIFSYIHAQRDRASLCRASQQMRRLVTPALYETVAIYLDGTDLHSPFFREDNPGHPFIKNLVFDGCSTQGLQGVRCDILNTLIMQTLARVKKDALQCFVSPSTLPLTLPVLRALRDTQQKLHHLELGPMPTIVDFGYLSPRDWLDSLRSLTIPEVLGSPREQDFYNRIILHPKKLTTLSMRCTYYVNGFVAADEVQTDRDRGSPEDLHEGDLKTRPIEESRSGSIQAVVDQLFGPLKGRNQSDSKPIIIHHLILTDCHLEAAILSSRFRFETLKHLTVTTSEDDDRVPWTQLAMLARTSRLRLSGFRYYQTDGETSHLVEDFLKSFAGLEILVLQGLPDDGLDMKALYSHLPTLERLAISGDHPQMDAHVPQMKSIWREDFTFVPHTTLQMRKLKHLSLPFPHIGVRNMHHDPDLMYTKHTVRIIAKLPMLETLRMWTWPLVNYRFPHEGAYFWGPSRDDITSAQYVDTMSSFAQRFVSMLADAYLANGTSFPVRVLKIGTTIVDRDTDKRVLDWRAKFCFRISAVRNDEGDICDYKTSRMTAAEVRETTPVFDELGGTTQDEDGLGFCELSRHTWREVEGWP